MAKDKEESPSTKPPGPSKLTIYPASILQGHGDNDVAIYFPDKYVPSTTVDLLVYFHGLLDRCGGKASDNMETYLKNSFFPLRELTNKAGKNMVLVVPRLVGGSYGLETGMDADLFLKTIVTRIAARVKLAPFNWKAPATQTPEKSEGGLIHEPAVGRPEMTIGKLIVAAHSGGGVPMLQMARTATVAKVQECWGFDSLYGGYSQWVDWAAAGGKFFLFWTAGGGNNASDYGKPVKHLRELLQKGELAGDPKKEKADPDIARAHMAEKNVIVVFADNPNDADNGFSKPPGRTFTKSTSSHCAVPRTYWPDMMQSFT